MTFILAAVLFGGCSTTHVSPEEVSSAVPHDFITKHQLPVKLDHTAVLDSSVFGRLGDVLVFVDAQGEKFTVYRLLTSRAEAPLFSPSREVGRLAVGDSYTAIRLVDYRGEEGRVLSQILASVPSDNNGFRIAEECGNFLKKKRKGRPNQAAQTTPGLRPAVSDL